MVEGAGAFSITGGNGTDTITGGDNIDTITGGAGADTVTGGAGADKFVIAADAVDVILDLTSGDDFISTGTAAATYEAITDDGTIAAAGSVAAAVNAAYVIAGVGNNGGIEAIGFVFGGKNYIAVEASATGDGTGAFVADVDDLTGLAAANFIV